MQGLIRKVVVVGVAFGVVLTGLTFSAAADASIYDGEVKKLDVSYSDLDLSQAEDASALYRRIERAAERVCKVEVWASSYVRAARARCMEKAVRDAVRTVANPNLTAVYVARTGKSDLFAAKG